MRERVDALPLTFRRLWSASIASNLSDGLLRTVVPIYAITLTESPIYIALISAMTLLPWLFFAVIIGTLADRVDRKKLLVISTLVRTAIVATMALAISTGVMTIHLLLLLIFLAGACEVSIDTTAQSMIPQILENNQLERGNSRLYVAETIISQFIGAPLGGFLYAAAIVIPFYASSFTYLLALGLILLMPYQAKTLISSGLSPDAPPNFTAELKFGVRYLFTHRKLRRLVFITTTMGFLYSASNATVALFMVKELDLDPKLFGVVLALQGIGGLIGGVATSRLSSRYGRGRVLASSILVTSILIFLSGFAPGIVTFTVLAGLANLAGTLWNILLMSTYQVLIPNELYGRVHGARRTIVWGLMPLGSFLGGVIATFGLRWPFVICGALAILVASRSTRLISEIGNSTVTEE